MSISYNMFRKTFIGIVKDLERIVHESDRQPTPQEDARIVSEFKVPTIPTLTRVWRRTVVFPITLLTMI